MINIDILERNIGYTRRNINKIIQKLKDKELLRILKIKDKRYVQLSEKGLYVIKCMIPQFIKYKNLKERIPNNENFKEVNALIELSELYDSLKHDDEIFY